MMAPTSLKLLTNILFGTKWRVHYYHSCTLELSPCHWRLTFAFGQLLGTQDFMVRNLCTPCNRS